MSGSKGESGYWRVPGHGPSHPSAGASSQRWEWGNQMCLKGNILGTDGTLFPELTVHQGLSELAHPELTLCFMGRSLRGGVSQPCSQLAEGRKSEPVTLRPAPFLPNGAPSVAQRVKLGGAGKLFQKFQRSRV